MKGRSSNGTESPVTDFEFLSQMSHEVRTPMNCVLGFTQLLEDTGFRSEQADFVRMIRANCEGLLGLTDSTLDFADIVSGNMELFPQPVELEKCVAETLADHQVLAEGNGLALEYQIARAKSPGTYTSIPFASLKHCPTCWRMRLQRPPRDRSRYMCGEHPGGRRGVDRYFLRPRFREYHSPAPHRTASARHSVRLGIHGNRKMLPAHAPAWV